MIKQPVALNALRAIEAVARLGALEPGALEITVMEVAAREVASRAFHGSPREEFGARIFLSGGRGGQRTQKKSRDRAARRHGPFPRSHVPFASSAPAARVKARTIQTAIAAPSPSGLVTSAR